MHGPISTECVFFGSTSRFILTFRFAMRVVGWEYPTDSPQCNFASDRVGDFAEPSIAGTSGSRWLCRPPGSTSSPVLEAQEDPSFTFGCLLYYFFWTISWDPSLLPTFLTRSGYLWGRACVQISGGWRQTFALFTDGHLYGWGWNKVSLLSHCQVWTINLFLLEKKNIHGCLLTWCFVSRFCVSLVCPSRMWKHRGPELTAACECSYRLGIWLWWDSTLDYKLSSSWWLFY
jgi:hypothetical protein